MALKGRLESFLSLHFLVHRFLVALAHLSPVLWRCWSSSTVKITQWMSIAQSWSLVTNNCSQLQKECDKSFNKPAKHHWASITAQNSKVTTLTLYSISILSGTKAHTLSISVAQLGTGSSAVSNTASYHFCVLWVCHNCHVVVTGYGCYYILRNPITLCWEPKSIFS